MDYARYAASNKAGVYEINCLEITHSLIAPIRRAMWPADLVTSQGTFTNANDAGGWDSAKPKIDGSDRAERTLRLDDVDIAVLTALNSLIGSTEFAQCVIRIYLSTDLTAPAITENYTVNAFGPISEGILPVTVGTTDVGNQRFPRAQHTLSNTPGLRGRENP